MSEALGLTPSIRKKEGRKEGRKEGKEGRKGRGEEGRETPLVPTFGGRRSRV
jgi:hypothetical protein